MDRDVCAFEFKGFILQTPADDLQVVDHGPQRCFLKVSAVIIVLISSVALLFYVRQNAMVLKCNMIVCMLTTNTAFGLLTLIHHLFIFLFNQRYLHLSSPAKFFVFSNLTLLSQNIVSVSSIALALDRVLIMSIPVRYKIWKVGKKLFIVVFVLNWLVSPFTYCLVLFFSDLNDLIYLVNVERSLKHYVFYPITCVETVCYVIFALQYRDFTKRQTRYVCRKTENAQNQIIWAQMVCHTSLVFIPSSILSIDRFLNLRIEWIATLKWTYEMPIFSTSIMLSSLIPLLKMWPRRKVKTVFSVKAASLKSVSRKGRP